MIRRLMPASVLAVLAVLGESPAAAQAAAGWPLHGYDLSGRRFSPLAAIDTATVARLVPRWTYHSGVKATFQTTPIVVDGVMFGSLPFSGVAALGSPTTSSGGALPRLGGQPSGAHERGAAHVGLTGRTASPAEGIPPRRGRLLAECPAAPTLSPMQRAGRR
jgi:hypothetical protein